jgi:hypothetical protein
MKRLLGWTTLGLALVVMITVTPPGDTACCYFSAKDKDINQPAQKAYLTFDPATNTETFTVQPKFEGNALDFGMVIPTPSQPKLDPMPRDFFKHLAIFTILKHRKYPESKLLPPPPMAAAPSAGGGGGGGYRAIPERKPEVKILETGIVGTLEYKIIEAGRADDLYQWLKDNRYNYSGDEATLDFYIKKKWLFTVMKIDTSQMKKRPDGNFDGEVTPTRFKFTSNDFVYPLKITQISVKDKTEALFYVAAPYKTDLPGDNTYQFQWVPMLQNARGWYDKKIFGGDELPGKADHWLKTLGEQANVIVQKGNQLGFTFNWGQRPTPNPEGRIATTLEWARRISADDLELLKGQVAFTEKLPDPDEGFSEKDLVDANRRQQVYKVIQDRLEKYRKERPGGWLVREAPEAEVKKLKELLGHVQEGAFVTKFRKTFNKAEMNRDLLIVQAKWGDAEDRSEYTESLPTSPP